MNLKELQNDLESKGYHVKGIYNAEKSATGQAIRDAEGVNWKLVGAYVEDGNTLIRVNVPIYVKNEGTKDERAYYAEKVPESKVANPVKEVTFTESVKTYLDNQDWIAYEITSTNETQKMAIVKAYVQEDKSARAKNYLVKKSDKGYTIYEYIEG